MTRTELRLRCLEIADKPGRDHSQVLASAKAYETFVGHEESLVLDETAESSKAKKPEFRKPFSK